MFTERFLKQTTKWYFGLICIFGGVDFKFDKIRMCKSWHNSSGITNYLSLAFV